MTCDGAAVATPAAPMLPLGRGFGLGRGFALGGGFTLGAVDDEGAFVVGAVLTLASAPT